MFGCCKQNKIHPEPSKQSKVHPEPSKRLKKRTDRRLKCCAWEKTDNIGFHRKK